MRNLNAQFSNAFGTRIASGSDFEEEEVGWDLPLIQLENDLHPLTRYIRRRSRKILSSILVTSNKRQIATGNFFFFSFLFFSLALGSPIGKNIRDKRAACILSPCVYKFSSDQSYERLIIKQNSLAHAYVYKRGQTSLKLNRHLTRF